MLQDSSYLLFLPPTQQALSANIMSFPSSYAVWMEVIKDEEEVKKVSKAYELRHSLWGRKCSIIQA